MNLQENLTPKFSDAEIELIKNLSRLPSLKSYFVGRPQVGDFFFARAVSGSETSIHFKTESLSNSESSELWLPLFDDLLEISRKEKISFSQITDFIHRRRFADGREREGLLTLLFELNRAKART